MKQWNRCSWAPALLVAAGLLAATSEAQAHCDTMSGPVITAAQRALETGEVDRVLIWVQPGDDAVIRDEFSRARAARSGEASARAAADQRFFEALVRIHRAGEGAPYTGIKPADTDVGPAVTAADRALADGKPDAVKEVLIKAVEGGAEKYFRAVSERQNFRTDDVAAGRAYVKAYVEYTHYAEGLYEKATSDAVHSEHAQHAQHAAPAAHEAHDAHSGPATPHAADSGHATANGSSHAGHASHTTHLSWALVVVFGLALAGETGWLLRRRSRDRASRPGSPPQIPPS